MNWVVRILLPVTDPWRLASCKAPRDPAAKSFSESTLVGHWATKSSQWLGPELRPPGLATRIPIVLRAGLGLPDLTLRQQNRDGAEVLLCLDAKTQRLERHSFMMLGKGWYYPALQLKHSTALDPSSFSWCLTVRHARSLSISHDTTDKGRGAHHMDSCVSVPQWIQRRRTQSVGSEIFHNFLLCNI